MSQNIPNKGKQPIFATTFDPKNIPKQPIQVSNIQVGGRSAAISSMIKKSEIDLISLEKNPFGNYRTMLPVSPSPKSHNKNLLIESILKNLVDRETPQINEGNLMGKVEDLVIKKLAEYKEILATEFKKSLVSIAISDEEKKSSDCFSFLSFFILIFFQRDIKFLKENFKIQQSNTDQIISHVIFFPFWILIVFLESDIFFVD